MDETPRKAPGAQETFLQEPIAVTVARRLEPSRLLEEIFGREHARRAASSHELAAEALSASLHRLAETDSDSATAFALRFFVGFHSSAIEEMLPGIGAREAPFCEMVRDKMNAGSIRYKPRRCVFAFVARNPHQRSLSVQPLLSETDDADLARVLTRRLTQWSSEHITLWEILQEYSVFVSADRFAVPDADELFDELLAHLVKTWFRERTGDQFSLVVAHWGLTLVRVSDIQKQVDRLGKGPRKDGSEGTPGDATRTSQPRRVAVSIDALEEFLANAAPDIPVRLLSAFESLTRDLLHDRFVPLLQEYLDLVQQDAAQKAGGNFGSFEANKAFVDALRATLRRLDVRLECPTCHRPANLFVQQGDTTTGSFVFRHTTADLRTKHGGKTELPVLRLVTTK